MFYQNTTPKNYVQGLLSEIDIRVLRSQGTMSPTFSIRLPQGHDNAYIKRNKIDTSYSVGAYAFYCEIIKLLPPTVQVQLSVGPVSSSHTFMGRVYKDPPNAHCELLVTLSPTYIKERYQYYYCPDFESRILNNRMEELNILMEYIVKFPTYVGNQVFVGEGCLHGPDEYDTANPEPVLSYSKIGLKNLDVPQQYMLAKVLTELLNDKYKGSCIHYALGFERKSCGFECFISKFTQTGQNNIKIEQPGEDW